MNSHKKFARTALATACCFVFAPVALAGVELVNVTNAQGTTKVTMGGYAKVDVRHVSGDVAYQDYWLGNFPGGVATDTSHTGFNVRESRLNFKVQHNDISAVVEMDFYGGDGNEVVSNSTNPRLRHFYINYKNWMIGQNWSTFMPLAALPEALDFGGPHVGEVFIRQTQIRYTTGNWQFAIENPETNGDGDNGTSSSAVGVTGANADKDESIPDFVARYNHKADWGQVSVGTLFRKVDQGGIDETAIAANVSGRIKTVGKDDFRFQISVGEPGRYVSAALTPDIVLNADEQTVVEETTAFTVAYRHFWNESTRSTIFYGAAETDTLER
ncbi:MAG: DcaP family trimeric outer membrane transporter, partial [Glaciecola sp.]